MKNPKKIKPLLVDKDGVGRCSIPKAWIEMLEWERGDELLVVCNLGKEEVSIKKV